MKIQKYTSYVTKILNACEYGGDGHSTCNFRYSMLKEITVTFHNGSIYDYHFIIKELAEEFERPFNCLGENTKKNITFSSNRKQSYKN